MVASVDTRTGNAALFGLPRNMTGFTFSDGTPFPGLGKGMLNEVYPWGLRNPEAFGGIDPGASAIKDVASNLLGIPIDYFILIDMAGFARLIDVLGGLTIPVRRDIAAPIYNREDGSYVMTVIPAGTQTLDGDLALAYARSRTGSNDYSRMARQRCVITAVAEQADPLSLLARLGEVLETIEHNVTTDITPQQIPDLVNLAPLVATDRVLVVGFDRGYRVGPVSGGLGPTGHRQDSGRGESSDHRPGLARPGPGSGNGLRGLRVTGLDDLGPYPAADGYDTALGLDLDDPLAGFRERFAFPDSDLIYLDGNSLGRLPLDAQRIVADVVGRQWGDRLIRSWNEGWWDLQLEIGDLIAPIVGAGQGEVVVSDSTSVNLFKLAWAAAAASPDRHTIVTDDLNFPTDIYVLDGVARRLGGDRRLVVVESDGVHGPVDDIAASLDGDTALLSLSHTTFKSGYTYDLAALTDDGPRRWGHGPVGHQPLGRGPAGRSHGGRRRPGGWLYLQVPEWWSRIARLPLRAQGPPGLTGEPDPGLVGPCPPICVRDRLPAGRWDPSVPHRDHAGAVDGNHRGRRPRGPRRRDRPDQGQVDGAHRIPHRAVGGAPRAAGLRSRLTDGPGPSRISCLHVPSRRLADLTRHDRPRLGVARLSSSGQHPARPVAALHPIHRRAHRGDADQPSGGGGRLRAVPRHVSQCDLSSSRQPISRW